MLQYFVNIWNAVVAFFANAGPMVLLSAVAVAIIGVVVALYIDNLERTKEMREIDEQGWGHLAEALLQAQEKIEQGPLLPINAEYCWHHDGENMGGWTCQHSECVSPGLAEDEKSMQAMDNQLGLDMSIIGKNCECGMFMEEGHQCLSEDERLESSAQRWQDSQADQDFWQCRAAECGHARDCDCHECCGSEPPSDSPDDPVCDCGARMKDLVSFWGRDLDGHIADCKKCGKKTFHQAKEDGLCISCGHSTGIDAEGSVYVDGKVTYDAEQAWYQGYERR